MVSQTLTNPFITAHAACFPSGPDNDDQAKLLTTTGS